MQLTYTWYFNILIKYDGTLTEKIFVYTMEYKIQTCSYLGPVYSQNPFKLTQPIWKSLIIYQNLC